MKLLKKISCSLHVGCPEDIDEVIEIDWTNEEPVKVQVKNQLREISIRLLMLEKEAEITVRRYE